jgi:CheY-like chemotaxis protein
VSAGRLGEVRQALSDARDGARRVTTIVRDLKTFSRADEERSGPLDLHPVLESSVQMAFTELKHRARVVKAFGPVPPVAANEARLGQVFLNLLINAAQAIPAGRVEENEIHVSTRTDASGRAVVEVRDTGTGMPPEVARHAFDPFFTTKPVGVGTGLGLFICRNIVAALGGEIAAETLARGTLFRVVLPPAQPPAAEPPRSAPGASGGGRGRRGRILVVDDEAAVGSALRRLLQAEHEVTVTTCARDARDRLSRGERFDAILCDVMMPAMSGIELHAEIEAIAPEQADRVVLLTGGAFTAAAREFLERWPHRRLDKPVDVDELRAAVRALVG